MTIWCDNKSTIDCTQKDGSHKLKNFDDTLEETKNSLENREKIGSESHMAITHRDYIKSCVSEGKVIVRWVSTKENEADINEAFHVNCPSARCASPKSCYF